YAAVIKLDTLTDSIGTTAENHDLVAAGRIGLALFLIGRVHVRRIRGKFGSTGIDALVDRQDLELVTMSPQVLFSNAEQFGKPGIGKAFALELVHDVAINAG